MDLQHHKKRGPKPGSPKTGGRKKGTPNKSTTYLRQALADVGCSIEEALAKAIHSENTQMIQALSLLLPYLTPKFKDADAPMPEDDIAETLKAIDEHTLQALSS